MQRTERYRAKGLSFVVLVAVVTFESSGASALGRTCLDDPLWPIFTRGAYEEITANVTSDPNPAACALAIGARATVAQAFCAGFGRPDDMSPFEKLLQNGARFSAQAVQSNGGLIDGYLEQAHANGFLIREFGARQRTETTLNALQRALAIDPENPEALVGIGLFQLGVGMEKTRGFIPRTMVWIGDQFFIADATDEPNFRMNVRPSTAVANIRRGLANDPGSLILAHAVVSNWNKLLERLGRDDRVVDIDQLVADLETPDLVSIVAAQRDVIVRAAQRDDVAHYQRCMICAVDASLRPADCPPWVVPP